MKTLWFSLLLVACLFAAGCRQDPYLTALHESMNAEKRALEDRIYELDDECEALEDQLDSTRRENNKLRQQIRGGPAEEPAAGSAKQRSSIFPRAWSGGKSGSSPDLETPKIDLGTPSSPEIETPRKPAPKGPEMNGARGAPHELPSPAEENDLSEGEPEDQRVTHIVLNPFLTGGHDFDNKPGDDGVSIVVEPRNAGDLFVPQAGPISIVVIDPEIEGEEGRIARWDYDSIEAGKRMKKTRMGRGINLKLPWPNQPPEHNKLKIFVRYETLEGLKLQADREVTIALPGQYSQRWTPRPGEGASVLVGHVEENSLPGLVSPKPTAKTARRPIWQPNR